MAKQLTEQERKLAQYYVLDGLSLRESAIKAEFAESTANSNVYLWARNNKEEGGKPELQAYIAELSRNLEHDQESNRALLRATLRSMVLDGERRGPATFGAMPVALDTKEYLEAVEKFAKLTGAYAPTENINRNEHKVTGDAQTLEALSKVNPELVAAIYKAKKEAGIE